MTLHILIHLSALLLLLYPYPLLSQENLQQAEGIGYIYLDDIKSAKEMAVKDALGKLVMDTIEEIVVPLTFKKDREILDERYTYNPADFIQEFRILSEGSEREVYKVSLEAVVAKDTLRENLSNIGFPSGLLSFPRVLVMMGEKRVDEGTRSFWWRQDNGPIFGIASTTFATELADSSFDVIDPFNPPYRNEVSDLRLGRYSLRIEDLKEWGVIYGTDLVIFGETTVDLLEDFFDTTEGIYRASTSAKILDITSGEEIFSIFVQKSFISNKDTGELEKALREFSREIVKGFIVKLIDLRKEKERLTISIEVLVRGVDSYDNYVDFKKALWKMDDWVNSLQEKRFSRGEVLMDIEIKGDPFLFKEDLQVLDLQDVILRISSYSKKRISLMMMPKR